MSSSHPWGTNRPIQRQPQREKKNPPWERQIQREILADRQKNADSTTACGESDRGGMWRNVPQPRRTAACLVKFQVLSQWFPPWTVSSCSFLLCSRLKKEDFWEEWRFCSKDLNFSQKLEDMLSFIVNFCCLHQRLRQQNIIITFLFTGRSWVSLGFGWTRQLCG